MSWRNNLAKMIVVEEYYIHIDTSRGQLQVKVRYVQHNGYTVIEPLTESSSVLLEDFEDWLKHRIDLNTRYDRPHWYHPIRFNRKARIVKWALGAVQRAYNQYYQEKADEHK